MRIWFVLAPDPDHDDHVCENRFVYVHHMLRLVAINIWGQGYRSVVISTWWVGVVLGFYTINMYIFTMKLSKKTFSIKFKCRANIALDWRILDHTCKNSRSRLASCGAPRTAQPWKLLVFPLLPRFVTFLTIISKMLRVQKPSLT